MADPLRQHRCRRRNPPNPAGADRSWPPYCARVAHTTPANPWRAPHLPQPQGARPCIGHLCSRTSSSHSLFRSVFGRCCGRVPLRLSGPRFPSKRTIVPGSRGRRFRGPPSMPDRRQLSGIAPCLTRLAGQALRLFRWRPVPLGACTSGSPHWAGDSGPVQGADDIGIAKAIDQRLTQTSMFTRLGQVVGTIDHRIAPTRPALAAADFASRPHVATSWLKTGYGKTAPAHPESGVGRSVPGSPAQAPGFKAILPPFANFGPAGPGSRGQGIR